MFDSWINLWVCDLALRYYDMCVGCDIWILTEYYRILMSIIFSILEFLPSQNLLLFSKTDISKMIYFSARQILGNF